MKSWVFLSLRRIRDETIASCFNTLLSEVHFSVPASLLQQQANRNDVPIIVVFEGWEAAGKGSRIGDLTASLDPRTFNVYSTEKPVGHEKRKPFMERFWTKIGAHGSMTIFDRSWYSRIAALLAEKSKKRRLKLKQDEFGLPLDRLAIPYGGEEMSEAEAVIEAVSGKRDRFVYEASDLVYHFLVLMEEMGVTIEDLEEELAYRHR